MTAPRKQRGVALITVLMVVAIVALLATEMGGRLQLNIKRQSNQQQLNQAYWYAVGAEVLAKNVIQQSFKDEPDKVHLEQLWAMDEMAFPVDGGMITGSIKDLSACFNLNSLSNKPASGQQSNYYVASLMRLLNELDNKEDVELDEYSNEVFANSVADWVDRDNMTNSSYGAEDSEYESKELPYEAANSLMVNLSEVMAINQGSNNIYQAIKELACVIPNYPKLEINVNTVATEHGELLAALIPGLSSSDAANILSARPEQGFDKIEDFWGQPELTAIANLSDEIKQQFSVTSRYFQINSQTTYNQAKFKLASVLYVDQQSKVTVIAREIGGTP